MYVHSTQCKIDTGDLSYSTVPSLKYKKIHIQQHIHYWYSLTFYISQLTVQKMPNLCTLYNGEDGYRHSVMSQISQVTVQNMSSLCTLHTEEDRYRLSFPNYSTKYVKRPVHSSVG